jgi:PGF-pre-PGF domain-containing protein
MGKIAACSILAVMFFSLLAPLSGALQQSQTYSMGPVEGRFELEIDKPWVSLEGLSFDMRNQKQRFTLRIDRIDSDEEWVYEYFQISAVGLTKEPNPVDIKVRFNRSWILEEGIEPNTLSLMVLDQEWEELPLYYSSEDSDFMHFDSRSPKLLAIFAVTGEPIPFEINVSSPCNSNYVCEPERGEDSENCYDCVRKAAGKCVPGERYCVDEYVLDCNEDGTGYTLTSCPYGCSGGECLDIGMGPPTGAAVAINPMFLLVIGILVGALIYLAFIVKKMRSDLRKAEERKRSHEDVKLITKKR